MVDPSADSSFRQVRKHWCPQEAERAGRLLTVGVITSIGRESLRAGTRASWLRSIPEGVKARFVLRGVGMPSGAADEALDEAERHGDMLFLAGLATLPFADKLIVQLSRGALLSQFLWLECADRAFRSSRFIGTVDDDVWLHLPGIVLQLSGVLASAHAGQPAYIGHMGIASWREDLNLLANIGYGGAGLFHPNCTRQTAIVGPFSFASRVSFVSSQLVGLVVNDATRAQAMMLAYRDQDDSETVNAHIAEPVSRRPMYLRGDAWLGLALATKLRAGPDVHPIIYVTLGWDFFQDHYGLKTRRTNLIWGAAAQDGEFPRRAATLQAWHEVNHCDNPAILLCNSSLQDNSRILGCAHEFFTRCQVPSIEHWKEYNKIAPGWFAGFKCKSDTIDLYPFTVPPTQPPVGIPASPPAAATGRIALASMIAPPAVLGNANATREASSDSAACDPMCAKSWRMEWHVKCHWPKCVGCSECGHAGHSHKSEHLHTAAKREGSLPPPPTPRPHTPWHHRSKRLRVAGAPAAPPPQIPEIFARDVGPTHEGGPTGVHRPWHRPSF